MLKLRNFWISTVVVAALSTPAYAEKMGLGRAALPEEIAAWDMTVLPDGQGLRPGSGSVDVGEEVFAEKCAACHGDFGEGIDNWPVLVGGQNTLRDARPVKTIGSYWPYLSTVYDYVNRSMPFGEAQTITTDEVYAITAYILYSNGQVEDDFVLSNENFADIEMPNVGGFFADDRPTAEYPQFSAEPCMTDCATPVQVTQSASDMKVTPTDPDGKPAGTLPDVQAQAGSPAEAVPVVEAVAAADTALIEAGAQAFKKCAACHKVGEDAKSGVGPALNGIVGYPAGAVDGFKYSKALMDAAAGGLVWTPEELSAFLENPKTYLPKTKMSFAGLKKEADRQAIIAYLQTFEP
jgi:cytochrome c